MKLPPTPRVKTSPNDSLGHGMDAALTILLFFGIGFALDRWLDTTPWLTIGCFLLAAVGLFYTWKSRYSARMDELQTQRMHDATRHRQNADPESTIRS